MSAIVPITLAVFCGACLHAAVLHFWIGRSPPRQPLHLVFALLSVLVAVYVLVKLGSYHAATAAELVEMRRLEVMLAMTVMAVLTWFVTIYARHPRYRPPFVLSVLFGVAAVINFALPYGLAYESLPEFRKITLPWGEEVADLRINRRGDVYTATIGVVFAAFVYCGVACVKQYRRGDRHRAVKMGAALTVLLLCVIFNQVVNLRVVEFIHTAEFGYIALVLLMSVVLSHELRASRDALAASEAELHKYRDHLEDVVHERTTALEHANRELEAFSYSVSHDLRAPLRAVDGFAQALVEDYAGNMDDKGLDYLSRIRNGTQRMGLLIDDILNLSRVGRFAMQPTEVNLSAVAREIVDRLAGNDPARRVNVEIAGQLTATGDARLLHIALSNLLDNAWKYTGNTADARIEFRKETAGGATAFVVRDNGAGFDMKYAERLFSAFQRLHGTEFPGTGVGLATVQRIVHRHGGRVWAESEVGRGATFFFTLGEKAPRAASE